MGNKHHRKKVSWPSAPGVLQSSEERRSAAMLSVFKDDIVKEHKRKAGEEIEESRHENAKRHAYTMCDVESSDQVCLKVHLSPRSHKNREIDARSLSFRKDRWTALNSIYGWHYHFYGRSHMQRISSVHWLSKLVSYHLCAINRISEAWRGWQNKKITIVNWQ